MTLFDGAKEANMLHSDTTTTTARDGLTYTAAQYRAATNGDAARKLAIAPTALQHPDHWTLPGFIVEAVQRAVDASRPGSYRRSVLLGESCWSGADLCAAQRRWGGHYQDQRELALQAIQAELPPGWHVVRANVWFGDAHRSMPVYVAPDGQTYCEGA